MKDEKNKSKKKVDKMRIVTKIIAGLMAFLMVGSVIIGLVYYLIRLFK